MEALCKLNRNITVKVEAENIVGLIDELTKVRESIGAEPCGKCNSDNTYPNSRKIEDNTFYEIRCADCNAVLQLGIHKKDQNIYKKRMKTDNKGKTVKNDDGKSTYLPNKGWLKYNAETKEMQ